MRRKLVLIQAMVTRTVRVELSRAARRNNRSLSSHVCGILTEWVFNQAMAENLEPEKEKEYGSEKENIEV